MKRKLVVLLLTLVFVVLLGTAAYSATAKTKTTPAPAPAPAPAKPRYAYVNYVFNNRNDVMNANGRSYSWAQMWGFYNQMGADGWELIAVTPTVQDSIYADTGQINFTFKMTY
ncbi:MAG: hypothetical protein ACM3QZ_09670 [Solirubrobacterales bacterium]